MALPKSRTSVEPKVIRRDRPAMAYWTIQTLEPPWRALRPNPLTLSSNQELSDQADQYEQFATIALPISAPPALVEPRNWRHVPGSKARVLSFDGKWMPCSVHNTGRFLTISGVEIEGGMSGSPILNADGAAIGLISTDDEGYGNNSHRSLIDCLPPWLWRTL